MHTSTNVVKFAIFNMEYLSASNYFIIAVLINLGGRSVCQKLDINAFEYTRHVTSAKGGRLQLGHCVGRIEELVPGTAIEKRCTLPPKKEPSRFVSKELNDTMNFEVQNYNDIFVCLGLCDGHASSALGLLHNGDCFAVEIAGLLTFNQKTYIQAYVEYYRSGIDVQTTDVVPPMELRQYYEENYYLRDRSYGTMEVIILEMRFSNVKQVETLKRTRRPFQQMSRFLQHSVTEAGEPASTKLIRLSTAKEEFKILKYKKTQLQQVKSQILDYESEIFQTRENIRRNYIKPDLRYGMFPYIHTESKLNTTSVPWESSSFEPMISDQVKSGGCSKAPSQRSYSHYLEWEEACITEVKIDTALMKQKRLLKKCKTVEVEQCKNLPNIKKSLKIVKVSVHSRRAKWHKLDSSERSAVKTANKELQKLSKELRAIELKLKEISKTRTKKAKKIKQT